MKISLLNKIFGKVFPKGKDETLEFLEEMNNRFMEKIKSKYGCKGLEEYRQLGENAFNYQFNSSSRYPVHSDC